MRCARALGARERRPTGRRLVSCELRALLATSLFAAAPAAAQEAPPPGFTVAFIGDQGLGADSEAVLQLIRDEGADAVLHQGDFDYDDDPAAWEAMIDAILGPDFPYFASAGNHDEDRFFGPGGYQEVLVRRMQRLGLSWTGDLGVQSFFHFQGLFIVLTAPDVVGPGDGLYDQFIADALATDDSIWSVSSWHKNMAAMQVGGKSDETGWGVYEESRRGGAIIATAHEHSYSRTHLLSSMEEQIVASTEEPLVLRADDPATPEDEGRSFAFVSGLGGRSIRGQELDGPWWASVYTSDQGARFGALFGVFHFDGDPRLAYFYFKDVDGNVVDEFLVESAIGGPACSGSPDADGDGRGDSCDNCTLVANAGQADADADGFGNACDGDFNADLFVGGPDFTIWLACFNRATGGGGGPADDPDCEESDMSGDGFVGGPDFTLFLGVFNGPPGPSSPSR